MDIEVLREFATLAIVRNYSESARKLNLSQPTLSRHISALEAELRCSLVNRTVPLTLTHAGERILEDAQVILAAYDSMVETARVAGRNPQRIIAVQDYSFSQKAFDCISSCERRFEGENPDVTFKNIECASGQTICQMIERGTLDVGFVHTFDDGVNLQVPDVPDGMSAMRLPRFCGSLAFAYGKGSRLAAKGARGELSDLSDFENASFLSPTERYLDVFRDNFARFCEAHGSFRPKYDFRPMHSHRYFYVLDPGESAYVVWAFEGRENLSLVNGDLTATVFEKYRFNTYAVFAEDDEHGIVGRFVDSLADDGR